MTIDISALFETMIKLFAALAAGYLGAKLGFINSEFNQKLTKFTINITMPLLALGSVLNKEQLISNFDAVKLIGVGIVYFMLMIILAKLVRGGLRCKTDEGSTMEFMFLFSNIGFMGYPLVESVYGPDSLFYVTVFVLLFNLTIFTYGAALVSGDRSYIRISWKMFQKPVIVGALLAFLVYFTGITVPSVVATSVSYVGNLTTPFSMIIIGCSLAAIPMKCVFGNWRIYLLVFLKMVVLPIAGFYLLRPIISEPVLLGVLTIIMATPFATNSTIFALEFGGNQKIASSGVFISTLVSLVSVPGIMWLLFVR